MYETHVTTLSSNFSELYFQFDLRFEKDELSDRSKEMLWKTLKGKGKLKPAVFEKAFAKLKTLNFPCPILPHTEADSALRLQCYEKRRS